MKLRVLFVTIIFCFTTYLVVAQIDSTTHVLEGVGVAAGRKHAPVAATVAVQQMEQQKITALPSLQLSDVLKLFAGVVIKDYGGVGGMKTIAMRGFGSQHTMVSYDGLAVSDCQTGQVDISRFSLENVEQLSLYSGTEDEIFVPARLAAAASLIQIRTRRPVFNSALPFRLDFRLTGGSFGLFNPTLLLQNRLFQPKDKSYPKVSSSLNINYLQSDGHYPFVVYYGGKNDSTSVEKRQNSDVHTVTLEENIYVDFSARSQLNVKLLYYYAQRGLPGAVVFYNTHSHERLFDENAFGQLHFQNRFSQKFAYQLNAKFNFAKQRYFNPEYLNAAGMIDNRYIQREYYLSNVLLYTPHKILSMSLANDFIYNNMNASIPMFLVPLRLQLLTALGVFVDTRCVNIRVGLLHTGVANWAATGTPAPNLNRLSPSAGISVKPLATEELYLRAFYKNIFRLPSFNDLYYNEVGNRNLRPEDTHQVNIGAAYDKQFCRKKMAVSVSVDGYYNRVKDKIVAIPSKNLFVWSMLNFGKVEILGVDACATFQYQVTAQLSMTISGNYTYQRAVDKTEKGSKTYLHQIPYTPLHAGSGMVTIVTPWLTVSYTAVASGKRFTLQQNIAANELRPYSDHSLAIGHDFLIKKKVTLGAKVELLNLANNHYEIIRNYPMQGRSFRFVLKCKY